MFTFRRTESIRTQFLEGVVKMKVSLLCAHPVVEDGVRVWLSEWGIECGPPLNDALSVLQILEAALDSTILIVDGVYGLTFFTSLLKESEGLPSSPKLVFFGDSVSPKMVMTLFKLGIKGVMTKGICRQDFLACLRAVETGGEGNWFEEKILLSSKMKKASNNNLTPREEQVLLCLQLDLTNKQIASRLEINPGTVKIHLRHIFEKRGVANRYQLMMHPSHR